jgi:hypothetical protein
MTDHSRELEQRYRRWLALYPKTFRAEREEEMLAVLLEGAEPDQTRPRPREALDLAAHGVARRTRIPSEWDYRHAKWVFPLRIAIGLWLLLITCLLLGFDRGELWTIVTIPAMVLHFYIAYRIRPRPTTQ